jgi:hypothetical protein
MPILQLIHYKSTILILSNNISEILNDMQFFLYLVIRNFFCLNNSFRSICSKKSHETLILYLFAKTSFFNEYFNSKVQNTI